MAPWGLWTSILKYPVQWPSVTEVLQVEGPDEQTGPVPVVD